MTELAGNSASIETKKDLGKAPDATVTFWLTQDKIAEKAERSWIKKARKIVKRYRDERGDGTTADVHKFNILWSNVETLKPALYGQQPKPDVERRYKDQDPVGRLSAEILERALTYTVDESDMDSVMKAVTQDVLLPGRGVARVRYVPTFGDAIKEPAAASPVEPASSSSPSNEGANLNMVAASAPVAEPALEVTYECAKIDYVFWEDYREGPARTWKEVPWVRYRSYLTREELIERFGKEKGGKVTLDQTPKTGDNTEKDPVPDIYKKAEVWEIWDKASKKAIWIAPGTTDMVLDEKDDPLKLTAFFPNPNPLLATTTNDKRIPVPDYIEYQDQATTIDALTTRIEKLIKALKVAGVYAASEKQTLQQLLDDGTENKLIPVEDWAAFADKGGLENMILWLPIKQVAEVVLQLYNARDREKQILYEVTGIADIIRGATNPNETLGAQQIKSHFATLRLSDRQNDVSRFARDIIRLLADVIANHFSAATLSLITGLPQLDPIPPKPPVQPQQAPQIDQQTGQPIAPQPDPALVQWAQAAQAIQAKNQQAQAQFEAAVQLLKSDAAHDFRIDIETDSTIAPDQEAEKRGRVEFLQQMIPLLNEVVPIAQGNPALASLAKEITLFAARGFKVARSLEETFEKAFDAIGQMPPKQEGPQKAPPPQGEDPRIAAAELQQKAQATQGDQGLKKYEIDQRTQVAREANAIEAASDARKQQLAEQEAASQAEDRRAGRILEAQALASKEEATRIRASKAAQAATEGLI